MATDEDPAAADATGGVPGTTAELNGHGPEAAAAEPGMIAAEPPVVPSDPPVAAAVRGFAGPQLAAAIGASESIGASTAVDAYLAPPAPSAVAATRPPRVGETVGGALDLALAASARVRRASIYIGLVTLALAGPAVILFLALVRDLGGFEEAVAIFSGERLAPANGTIVSMFGVSTILAVIGLIAITFEGQIMATAIVGGAASDRRIGLRRSLRLSRKVFWSVFAAAFLVGILDRIVTLATAAIVDSSGGNSQAATIIEVAASGIATMPFGFYQAGIILGGVGAVEALRRSLKIARARWRLAFLVALAGIALSYVEIFALGAGLDVVLRFADAAGLGFESSVPVATLTVLLVLACIVAVGSLVVTIAALVAAPQVFVFLKMTGYSAGLDRAMAPAGGVAPKLPRLLTRPMIAVIALGFLCAVVGLASG